VGKIPTGLWSRGSKLVGIASKVAMNEITSRVKNWEDEKSKIAAKVELAQNIVKTMSELKGASMKVGQLLSMDLGEYFPPEVIKVLENLHQNSTFLPFETIKDILKEELGEKFNELSDISEIPLAAASIGQVHSAKLNEKMVVIKIQYPDVAASIPSDLKLLKVLLKNFILIQGKEFDLDPFFNEIQEVLTKETDYKNEELMLRLYKESFKDSKFIIPAVYPEFSTSKIICMDFIEGKSFKDWLPTSLLGERMRLAEQLMHLYLDEFFIHGLVQTDPNPGNFLITPENQMALLDFGAVKQYDRSFIDGYRKILIAAFEKDKNKVLEESELLGFIDPRESMEIKTIYLEMMELLAAPFRQEIPFDFTDRQFFEESQKLSWHLVKKCKYSPPPKDLLFLHRKLGGVFFLIKKLDAKIILKTYWHKVVISS
jgi:aarF domain-containing kinase